MIFYVCMYVCMFVCVCVYSTQQGVPPSPYKSNGKGPHQDVQGEDRDDEHKRENTNMGTEILSYLGYADTSGMRMYFTVAIITLL